MARALIIGCGAIGRGFIPWTLDNFEIDFYDSSREVVTGISSQGGYTTHMSIDGALSAKSIAPKTITHNVDELSLASYDVAFVAVGPRNVANISRSLSSLRCPVFSLENDPATVDTLTYRLSLKNVYFGVPDVITSSTASPISLRKDPFSLHTENGVLYLQDNPSISENLKALLPDVTWLPIERLNQEWDAKLYLHNTPHCIAAYLGFLAHSTYLHEALSCIAIRRLILGLIEEILHALKLTTAYDHVFLESYAEKELNRFSNPLLFDPISRVAREPIRKLHPSGRLVGALRLMLSTGVRPVCLTIGIAAALRYLNPDDKDYLILSQLDNFGISAFLKYHLGLSPTSLESQYLQTNLKSAITYLDSEIL